MDIGTLYIVATPIGNLEDITYRAVRVLKEADLIFCEDTRVTKKLLDHYKIQAETRSFYGRGTGARKPEPKFEYVLSELKNGKNVAFVTDAGTPGISDPGNQIIEHITHNLPTGQAGIKQKDIRIVPVPGPSALGTIISVAGIDMREFVFLGFPPHKKGRETFFKKLVSFDLPVIYYESPHRLIKNLELLSVIASEAKQSHSNIDKLNSTGLPRRSEYGAPRNDIKIILGRELTKMFEEIVRGNASEVLGYFEENKDKVKGEIVIIVY